MAVHESFSRPDLPCLMSGDSWPAAAELHAFCRLLCRPSPPIVPAGTLQAARNLEQLQRHLPGRGAERDALRDLEAGIEAWRRTPGAALVTFYDERYPPLLRHIAHPPVALFVLGSPAWLRAPAVALVGSRGASAAALAWTRDTAADLARRGILVTSGLARGIDAAAHVGALESGGATLAVLGCGPDRCYPPEHRGLAQRIAARGCLVTELPPGAPPLPWHFPMRNRILAGLVSGVVVVQAEPRSGALVTARLGLEENRQIMAVPGDVSDPRSRGPHQLLRDGAALVECAHDILEALGWILPEPLGSTAGVAWGPSPGCASSSSDASADLADADATAPGAPHRALLAALGHGLPVEDLRAKLGWSAAEVQRVLADLELGGALHRAPGGRVVRGRDPHS